MHRTRIHNPWFAALLASKAADRMGEHVKKSRARGKKRKRRNPLARSGKYEMTLTWRTPQGKSQTAFQRFPTADAARTASRRLMIALHRRGVNSIRSNVRERVPFNP